MAGIGLNAAKAKLQLDLQKALQDAFKATFYLGGGEEGDTMALKFAQKGSGPMADAILNFITQAQVVGTVNGIVTGSCAAGPVAGTNVDLFTGSELSLI